MLFLQHKPFTRKHLMTCLPAEIPASYHLFNLAPALNKSVSPQTFLIGKQFTLYGTLWTSAHPHAIPFVIADSLSANTVSPESFSGYNLSKNILRYRVPSTIQILHIIQRH